MRAISLIIGPQHSEWSHLYLASQASQEKTAFLFAWKMEDHTIHTWVIMLPMTRLHSRMREESKVAWLLVTHPTMLGREAKPHQGPRTQRWMPLSLELRSKVIFTCSDSQVLNSLLDRHREIWWPNTLRTDTICLTLTFRGYLLVNADWLLFFREFCVTVRHWTVERLILRNRY